MRSLVIVALLSANAALSHRQRMQDDVEQVILQAPVLPPAMDISPIFASGPEENRFNLVFFADGCGHLSSTLCRNVNLSRLPRS